MEANLISSFDLTEARGGKGLLGDIDGDGRMEIVFIQADTGLDYRYVPHQVTCVAAYRLTGELMWKVGESREEAGSFGSDFPAQIYDIDGDGLPEILCVMDKRFLILEGASGKVKESYALPAEQAHDCIIIANLSGKDRAEDIILKDRYFHMWALNRQFELLWTHEGNLGHFPWCSDVNGDGFDEVMAGYDLLNHKGEVLWSCQDLDDHADCIWVGDVNEDGRPEIVVGGSVTCMYDADGKELWRYSGSIESQHIALGKFLPDQAGLQVAGLDRIVRGDGYKGQWDGQDGMFMIDSAGQEVWKENRTTKGWLTIVETLENWNGEGRDYILAYRRGGGVTPALYDGLGNTVLSFPEDGYVLHADLFGRGKEDVIIYSPDTVWVYSGTKVDLDSQASGNAISQIKRLYMSTLYPGGER